jgi:hypothetical protein
MKRQAGLFFILSHPKDVLSSQLEFWPLFHLFVLEQKSVDQISRTSDVDIAVGGAGMMAEFPR